MANSRKDTKGRALRKGESQRKSDKRYLYSYTDPYGKRRVIYANDLIELREKEKQLIKDQLDGLDVYAAGDADFNYLFSRYIKTKSELRSSTYSHYLYTFNTYVKDTFGKMLIKDIKYSDVLYFYHDLIQNRDLDIGTVEHVHTIVHPALKLAVRDNMIRNNPSDGVMAELKKKLKKKHQARRALTIEQQKAFVKYVRESKEFYRWHPLFVVLLGTGCRIGEVVGLRWEDIDIENRTIDINHSVTYYPRHKDTYRCEFEVSLPKTEAGIRMIPMLDEVCEAFIEEREYQNEEGFNLTVIDGMTGFIFRNRFGGLHNPQGVNRAIKRITDSYNTEEILKAKIERRQPVLLPHFSCHILRHTFCTRFCESENNVKVIQAVMGHADIETTLEIYADVTESKKKEAFDQFAKNMKIF